MWVSKIPHETHIHPKSISAKRLQLAANILKLSDSHLTQNQPANQPLETGNLRAPLLFSSCRRFVWQNVAPMYGPHHVQWIGNPQVLMITSIKISTLSVINVLMSVMFLWLFHLQIFRNGYIKVAMFLPLYFTSCPAKYAARGQFIQETLQDWQHPVGRGLRVDGVSV